MDQFGRKKSGGRKIWWLALLAILVLAAVYALGRDRQPEPNENLTQLIEELNGTPRGEGQGSGNGQEAGEQVVLPAQALIEAPFTSQAPFGGWEDPRQQDGCEEASVLMTMLWAKGETANRDQALAIILDMAAYEEKNYGGYHDTSARDTVERLLYGYYDYQRDKVKLSYDIGADDIKRELAAGRLVIVPADGQKLGNPNFTGAGPERHMLVIKGYDDSKKQFITNDPGTRKGEGYKYNYDVLINAVRDYPTGYKVEITGRRTAMISVGK